jgi:ADP-ribose pyrophosphatase YjhB (NUDIX family)
VNFCSACGNRVLLKLVQGDVIPRFVCVTCNAVHYQNPTILVSCLAYIDDRLLMCRRAQDPGRGLWSVPAGFMEKNESVEQSAVRETLEETGVRIDAQELHLYSVLSLPDLSQVYITLRTELRSPPAITPGHESLDVRLLRETDIEPREWAFAGPAIERGAKVLFNEIRSKRFSIHKSCLIRPSIYESHSYTLA